MERQKYKDRLVYAVDSVILSQIVNKTLCGDLSAVLDKLPKGFADLLIIDPPYNLDKNFDSKNGGFKFSKTTDEGYLTYLKSWFPKVIATLKPTDSVYICGGWRSTFCLYQIMRNYTIVRNRITWQREKGRSAKSNWKNASEDIWFGAIGEKYYFDVEAVKQKRRVIAP